MTTSTEPTEDEANEDLARTPDTTSASAPPGPRGVRVGGILARAVVGGVLMGVANLVPGVSGGTMLLAVGIYPAFIEAIAEVTTMRRRPFPYFLLGVVGVSAAIAILLLAGVVHDLVVERRWVMYSLFIGLTLGGVPLLWRRLRPFPPVAAVGGLVGFGLMLWMALGSRSDGGAAGDSYVLLFLSGLAGASAMILPGVSGGYLLLLLGQYQRILDAIDRVKLGLLGGDGGGRDWGLVWEAVPVVLPVGIGVILGVVGVSHVIRWLLHRFEHFTLGALLGLLLGAVVGLWPFQEGVPPVAGAEWQGEILTEETAATIEPKEWPVATFRPTLDQGGGALAWLGVGLFVTLALDRVGGGKKAQWKSDESTTAETG